MKTELARFIAAADFVGQTHPTALQRGIWISASLSENGVTSTDVLIAALLLNAYRDVLNTKYNEIKEKFGPVVVGHLKEVAAIKFTPFNGGTEAINQLLHASTEAKYIFTADAFDQCVEHRDPKDVHYEAYRLFGKQVTETCKQTIPLSLSWAPEGCFTAIV